MRSLSGPQDDILTIEVAVAAQAKRRMIPSVDYALGLYRVFMVAALEVVNNYWMVDYDLMVDYLERRIPKLVVENIARPLRDLGREDSELLRALPFLSPGTADRIRSGKIAQALDTNYSLVREYPNFLGRGQTLRVYLRREEAPPPS